MKTIARAAKKLMPINSQFIVDHSVPVDTRRMLGAYRTVSLGGRIPLLAEQWHTGAMAGNLERPVL